MSESKVVIVTGGTYGIGKGITLLLASRGCRVVAFGLDEKQLGSAAEKGSVGTRAELERQGPNADVLLADVSKASEVGKVVDFAIEKYGRIDGLVNNAAIRPYGTVLDTSEETWDRVMDVNIKGMFLATKAVLPYMIEQGGGAIVNIASGSGWGKPNRIAYCASKGAVFAFSAALAYDHVHDRIRVNAVVPGFTASGMTEGREEGRTLGGNNVAGRNVLPEDIAKTVAYLLSDDAEVVSGAVITVGCFLGQGGPIPKPVGKK